MGPFTVNAGIRKHCDFSSISIRQKILIFDLSTTALSETAVGKVPESKSRNLCWLLALTENGERESEREKKSSFQTISCPTFSDIRMQSKDD